MAVDEKCSSNIDWNYPNLLSKETILRLLKLRGIDQPGIDSFDKNVLVDVYNRYLLPLPQRKYRMNRRGQQMTKKQIILAKMSKTPSDAEIKKNSAEPVEKALPRFMSPFTPSTDSSSPLKPPPSCINFERKTIKLNSSRTSVTSMDTSPPKTFNNGNKSSPDAHGSNNKTPEPINKTDKTIDSPVENKNTIESKRPADEGEKDCPEPCKKKKVIPRITWP